MSDIGGNVATIASRVLVVVSAADQISLLNGETAPTGTYLRERIDTEQWRTTSILQESE